MAESPEAVAFELLVLLRKITPEGERYSREKLLDDYAECLAVVRNPKDHLTRADRPTPA